MTDHRYTPAAPDSSDRCAVCGRPAGEHQEHEDGGEPVMHYTMGNAVLLGPGTGNGGLWAVECLCGWWKDGRFKTATEEMRAMMERIAEKTGIQHLDGVDRAAEHPVQANKFNHPSNPAWHPPSSMYLDRVGEQNTYRPDDDDDDPRWIPDEAEHRTITEDCPVCGNAYLGWRMPQHLRENHPGGEA